MVIKVEEPVYLTLQAAKADEYEFAIGNLRSELSNAQRQLADSNTQLADTSGNLLATQAMLAESHEALTVERQKAAGLIKEVKQLESQISNLVSQLQTVESNAVTAVAGVEGQSSPTTRVTSRMFSDAGRESKESVANNGSDSGASNGVRAIKVLTNSVSATRQVQTC